MQMVKVLRKDVLLCNEIESESTSFAYDMPSGRLLFHPLTSVCIHLPILIHPSSFHDPAHGDWVLLFEEKGWVVVLLLVCPKTIWEQLASGGRKRSVAMKAAAVHFGS